MQQSPNKATPNKQQLHRVVSTSRFKNISDETFISHNTLFSSLKGTGNNGNEVFDEKMRWEFYKFCFGFSMSCAMTVLAIFYSPMLTSEMIGGLGSGAFYLSFAYCSVGGAKLVVNYVGVKNAILCGHFGSSFYVFSFLLMTEYLPNNLLFYLNIVGATVGGASQSVMWAGLVGHALLKMSIYFS
jgi:hypothetical protein